MEGLNDYLSYPVHMQLFMLVANQFSGKAVRKQFNCFHDHVLTCKPVMCKENDDYLIKINNCNVVGGMLYTCICTDW